MKNKVYYKRIKKIFAVVLAVIMCIGLIFARISEKNEDEVLAADIPINGTIMQYFEWYLPNNGNLWNELSSNADTLKNTGFTAVWLPPAYKNDGSNSVGYAPYDLYDLGEFNQKGTTRTKYGTLNQYINAINACHNNNIDVYADIVLDHKSGADSVENVEAYQVYANNRNSKMSNSTKTIGAWTVFKFDGRGNTYSSFKWNYSCFDGVDYDNITKNTGVYLFKNKTWDSHVSGENGNYDYLMYADIDFGNTSVVNELKNWGVWYTNKCNLDGFRLDALKHIDATFFNNWLGYVRTSTGKEMFTVGEYWSGDINQLKSYLSQTNYNMSLFDVPLHYNFQTAGNSNGSYDLRNLFKNTLVSDNPIKAVTFVDNHDTQPGQSLQSTVSSWFKPLAYTAILTREGGYPCVFYGDYYGVGTSTDSTYIKSYKNEIDKLMAARTKCAYGTQHDYLDNADIIGWTREGLSSAPNSGLAALISDKNSGSKSMYVGTGHSGEVWYDITGNVQGNVTINSNGYGNFKVNGKSFSVWVNKNITANTITSGNNTTTSNTTIQNSTTKNTSTSNNSQTNTTKIVATNSESSSTKKDSTSVTDSLGIMTTNGDEETEGEKTSDEETGNEETTVATSESGTSSEEHSNKNTDTGTEAGDYNEEDKKTQKKTKLSTVFIVAGTCLLLIAAAKIIYTKRKRLIDRIRKIFSK